MQIGVIGGEYCPEKFRDVAEEVGQYIAENGAILICGAWGRDGVRCTRSEKGWRHDDWRFTKILSV